MCFVAESPELEWRRGDDPPDLSDTVASRRSDPLKHFFSSSAHLCANVNVGNVVE